MGITKAGKPTKRPEPPQGRQVPSGGVNCPGCNYMIPSLDVVCTKCGWTKAKAQQQDDDGGSIGDAIADVASAAVDAVASVASTVVDSVADSVSDAFSGSSDSGSSSFDSGSSDSGSFDSGGFD